MTTSTVLTAADLAAFYADGYVILESVFSPAECDDIGAHVEAAAFELALGEAAEGPLSYRPMMHLASPALTAVATDARWAPVVLPLVGTGDARPLLGAGRGQAPAGPHRAPLALGVVSWDVVDIR